MGKSLLLFLVVIIQNMDKTQSALTAEQETLILDKHNEFRSAAGATNMRFMVSYFVFI